MLLMIFVNDLWTLVDIPGWLGHASAHVDDMGLADFIFPAFLFIVGLSIPYAIDGRRKKGENNVGIVTHILWRTLALLTMGLFLVNAEVYGGDTILPKPVWMLLLISALFLIWLDYRYPTSKRAIALKLTGITLLFTLALLYRTETGNGLGAMQTYWWGILGLIGWCYLISSLCFLLTKGKLAAQIIILALFIFLNAAPYFNWLSFLDVVKNRVWVIQDGALPTLTTVGAITAILYRTMGIKNRFWFSLLIMAIILLSFGIATRSVWGISKIRATPSWATICAALSIICFAFFVFLTDVKKKINWYKLVKPAGTSTLTCYLLPYIHYSLLGFVTFRLPVFWRSAEIGLLKSLLYALLIVTVTCLLEKKNIRLRI
ncbi:DUF5009 domain-containing protein [Pedobacter sp. BS3]|uniref:DUF5009 domain-containing protein n=1 Tax=Pedobacter sp. BS3 TaxID=2567937 RepID=UPI001659FCA5